jgi:phosphoribosylformylglycinamidine synthase
MMDTLADLNVCSQKGLVEMFDGSIGAGSVFMPFGGKYQLTETQSMVAKIPVGQHKCDAVSMMSYGFDPYLSSWSPYHGSIYAVTESMARIVAAGGDYKKIRFTFQEYFRRMNEDPKRWSQPFAALLGAFEAQMRYGLPSIGGKDSMSGTFNDIDVPPTLVSFAVDTANASDIITPELKKAGNKLVSFRIQRDSYDLPVYEQVCKLFETIHALILKKSIVSCYVLDNYGMFAALSKMAFGNKLGFKLDPSSVTVDDLFEPLLASFVAEVDADQIDAIEAAMTENALSDFYCELGEVTEDATIVYGDVCVPVDEAIEQWKKTLEPVFPTKATEDTSAVASELYNEKNIYVCKNKVARPTVFIPVFPG